MFLQIDDEARKLRIEGGIKSVMIAADSEIRGDRLFLDKEETELAYKWLTHLKALPVLTEGLNDGTMDLTTSKRFYAKWEALCDQMRETGIFNSKYQFRTGWYMFDIDTLKIVL